MPLIKKYGLDKNDPANYRPISNLNTVRFLNDWHSLVSYRTSQPRRVSIRCNRPTEDDTQRRLHC
jgi:hypothetical protein